MFDGLSGSVLTSAAAGWGSSLILPLAIVIGFGLALILANWIAGKMGAGRKRRRGRRR